MSGRVRAAVVVLHGGAVKDVRPSRDRQLAALRLGPVVRALDTAVGEGVVVTRVRYRVRGWNGVRADPVRDTLGALDDLAERYGDVPTVLVGHSMGGRAALHAAGHPLVHAVVGLAPWWPPGEPVDQLAGRRVVALHGDRDHITSATETAELIRRAQGIAVRADLALVAGGDHAMLRRYRVWQRTTAALVAHLVDPGAGPDPLPADLLPSSWNV
ncbi:MULTISPECIES: dienelactone hydrolase family protein [unclassified Streptomyces]|uniref:dienelactone hydrolase family protein n=1 Tax=unclassified Streptomyces TaxID=2593676 RepID=UPI000DDA538E|nr:MULTISPECIES: alpha/beta fold hydrolase [unclassified Streptomyces]QZZ25408.1 alpha/beta fold hydrolase [Streptomyces sp. ST1015]